MHEREPDSSITNLAVLSFVELIIDLLRDAVGLLYHMTSQISQHSRPRHEADAREAPDVCKTCLVVLVVHALIPRDLRVIGELLEVPDIALPNKQARKYTCTRARQYGSCVKQLWTVRGGHVKIADCTDTQIIASRKTPMLDADVNAQMIDD